MGAVPCTGPQQKPAIAVTYVADEGNVQMGADALRKPPAHEAFWRPALLGSRSAAVILNIYDVGASGVGTAVNSLLRPMGLGAFHCGVQIHDKEWSYSFVLPDSRGGCHTPTSSGVFACKPRSCPGHSFCEAVPMGYSSISEHGLWELLVKLDREWPAMDYDLLERNCCHFCEDMCLKLGLGGLPPLVTKLAAAGASLASGEVRVTDCCAAAVAASGRCTSSCCGPGGHGVTRIEKVLLVPPPAGIPG